MSGLPPDTPRLGSLEVIVQVRIFLYQRAPTNNIPR